MEGSFQMMSSVYIGNILILYKNWVCDVHTYWSIITGNAVMTKFQVITM